MNRISLVVILVLAVLCGCASAKPERLSTYPEAEEDALLETVFRHALPRDPTAAALQGNTACYLALGREANDPPEALMQRLADYGPAPVKKKSRCKRHGGFVLDAETGQRGRTVCIESIEKINDNHAHVRVFTYRAPEDWFIRKWLLVREENGWSVKDLLMLAAP